MKECHGRSGNTRNLVSAECTDYLVISHRDLSVVQTCSGVVASAQYARLQIEQVRQIHCRQSFLTPGYLSAHQSGQATGEQVAAPNNRLGLAQDRYKGGTGQVQGRPVYVLVILLFVLGT